MKRVLDVCCGSRMFWFDRDNANAVFVDRRIETQKLKAASMRSGFRDLVIKPNVQADFRALPFPSGYFHLVVFDPPHFDNTGPRSWLRAKYGTLDSDWEAMLRLGFAECFRVLLPGGTLIFKWSSVQIPVSRVLALSPVPPLLGHKSGKQQLTHWVSFMKT